MRKYLCLAALLCGISFASFGMTPSTEGDNSNEVVSHLITDLAPEQQLQLVVKVNGAFYELNICGHTETIYGSFSEAIEYLGVLASIYCH